MMQEQVNTAIKAFYDEFNEKPYLHRCEHSLHISLYNKLIKKRPESFIFNNDKKLLTNYVHKEFPGRRKTDKSSNLDRTQIDIAVLAENQHADSINDFLYGNFDIDYTFELALEYGIEHLSWDIFKFITGSNKSINHKNYIVHLYHKKHSTRNIDKIDNAINLNDRTIENDLNKSFEKCYYLIKLCINYSEKEYHKDYEKILEIVIDNVNNKNKKYDNTYLLETTDVQQILKKMKFIFFNANPQTKITLMNKGIFDNACS